MARDHVHVPAAEGGAPAGLWKNGHNVAKRGSMRVGGLRLDADAWAGATEEESGPRQRSDGGRFPQEE